MKLKSEKGFTGVDIAISIVVLFIFVSLIAMLIYNFNISAKQATRKTTAINLAIEEIENIKNKGFTELENIDTTPNIETGEEGFLKTIVVEDYKDIAETEGITEAKKKELVKRVKVTISYNSQGKEENVELSTILTKENE